MFTVSSEEEGVWIRKRESSESGRVADVRKSILIRQIPKVK